MAYSKQTVKSADELLEKRRKAAIEKAQANLFAAYEKIPELEQIDKALQQTGLNVYKSALMGLEGLDERIEKIKRENLMLQQERKNLLVKNGFPEDFTEEKFHCKKCKDTGYVGIEMCICKKKALSLAAFSSAGLGKSLKDQSFDNFDLNYYSDKAEEGKTSAREAMRSILEKSKEYVKCFDADGSSNLLFTGKTGLGKTHITTAIAKGVIEKGFDVVYDSAQNIMHAFEMQRFERDETAKFDADRFFSCDLLIIDDLGTEFRNSFTQSALYNLINTRINNMKPMIVSTNLDDMKAFKKTYDDRITSRFIGNFRTFHFEGNDIRLIKAKNNRK